MKHITKKNQHALQKDIDLAMQMVAEQHGLYYSYEGGRYSGDELNGKFKLQTRHDDGVPATFARHARDFGFCPSIWGKCFSTAIGRFKILEINPKRSKYPVGATCIQTGEQTNFTLACIRKKIFSVV